MDGSENVVTADAGEVASVASRNHAARRALILGIGGLLLFPLTILPAFAVVYGLRTLRRMKAARSRGMRMAIAGTALGTFGLFGAALLWLGAYLELTATLPEASVRSAKVDADGLRYLSNRANMLRDFAAQISQGRIKEGQVVSLSSTTEGRKDTIKIATREGVQTAPGFRLELDATSSQKNGATVSGVQGNLIVLAKSASKPALPTTAALARAQSGNSAWRGLLALAETPTAAAAERKQVFATAEPEGGRVIVTEDRVELLDSGGNKQGEYTFTGDNVVESIQEVLDYKVAAPDDEVGRQGCRQGGLSVDNARVFVTSWDRSAETSSGKQADALRAEIAELERRREALNQAQPRDRKEIEALTREREDLQRSLAKLAKTRDGLSEVASLAVQKVGSYDCKTGQRRAYFSLDFKGEINGRGFQGLVHAPQPVPPPAPKADMEAVQAQMKKAYLDSTGRELVTWRCEGQRLVTYRDSPVKCSGTDSEQNSVSAEVTVDEQARVNWKWGPIVPLGVDMSKVMQVIQDSYRNQTGRPLIELLCDHTGVVTYRESPVRCRGVVEIGVVIYPVVTIDRNARYKITIDDSSTWLP